MNTNITIEIPVYLPIIGLIVFIIFCYFLFKINILLKQIKDGSINIKKSDKIITTQDKPEKIIEGNLITSPMVGVVYLRPEPSKPQFINIGDHIKQGDTIALIEAMKTFNEIRSTHTGVVKKILISNGKPVEYGEHIVIIE